jgi:hypothetical protein
MGKTVSMRDVERSYSDNGENYYDDKNINDNIVIVPTATLTNSMTTIELPGNSSGVSLEDGNVNACLITNPNNRRRNSNAHNNGSCIGNSKHLRYGSVDLYTISANLKQTNNGVNVQPNVTNMNVSTTLDNFASVLELNANQSNNVQTATKQPIDVATENIIKEEIVQNVQKNTENIVKNDLSDKVSPTEADDISKNIAVSTASSVEQALDNSNLISKNTIQNTLSKLIESCVNEKLKEIYMDNNALNNAVATVTNNSLNDIEPNKYKLLVEIATNQMDVKSDIQNLASTIKQVLSDSATVVNNGENTIVKDVNVKQVLTDVKNTSAQTDGITNAIKNIKQTVIPEVFVIKGPGNKMTLMVENNIIPTANEKLVKNVVNAVTEQLNPNEHFTQHGKSFTNFASRVFMYDNNQNRIDLDSLVNNIIEHMTEKATIVTPLENQTISTDQVNQAAVSINNDQNKITIVPQMDQCNCSSDQLKDLCAKISLDTGAKKVEVEVTPQENKQVTVTVEKPIVSVESTIKTTLDAVNEQLSKTTTNNNTNNSNAVESTNVTKSNSGNQFIDLFIWIICIYLVYTFMTKSH